MRPIIQKYMYSDLAKSKLTLSNLSDYDRGWITGLFDGEGCVFFFTSQLGYKSPGLNINLTDLDVLQRFHKLVGGLLDSTGRHFDNRKTIYKWHTSGWVTVRHFFNEFKDGLSLRRQQRFKEILKLEPKRLVRPPSCGSDPKIATRLNYQRHYRKKEPACITCCAQVSLFNRQLRNRRKLK